MKIKNVLLIFLFCIILVGCKDKDKDTKKDDNVASSELSSEEQGDQVKTDDEAKAPATEEADKENTDYLDYSNHTQQNEKAYVTLLADPSKLKNGEHVFATTEPLPDWSRMTYSGKKQEIYGYDMRSCDVSMVDFSKIDDLSDITFNSDTKWPEVLPEGFDPEYILEYNKNPGLGIRALHERGIKGTNIGIAIIDQGLLLNHEQYKDNLMYYEKIHCVDKQAQMHGPAVASIATGKTIGVAPEAKLYYIASTFGHFGNNSYEFDAVIMADCILRVLEINKNLSEEEKIRVISISKGYSKEDKGYQELTEAIDKANEENIFVITTSTEEYYDFKLFGMSRDYLNDPDDIQSYTPAAWIADGFYANPKQFSDLIQVPMGSRTCASCTGIDNYDFSRQGGLSWAVPWCAGFYALCCQVDPEMTPEKFIDVVKSTAITTTIQHDNKSYEFGEIINPASVIEALIPS